jgi:CheY-like chemotaxis protein
MLVKGMADLVASTSGPHIKVVADLALGLPCARSDPNQLEMAILNLSVNARDAMPDGGTLTISAAAEQIGEGHRSLLEPGEYVRVSVSDTGVGMDEHVLARAVEPFFSTKGIGKGTGLGLSMVHGLASQLGGAMLISSKPRLGTTVDLFLPVAEALPQAEGEQQGEAAAPAQAGKVLLVDDEDLVRASTAEMLVELGYAVTEASSAKEALERLADARFDYVVTDHLMPGISGMELARAVAEQHPATTVLIISGYADIDEISAKIPRLSKPFRQEELAEALREARASSPSSG